ncbi:MAG: hypothetical protein ACYCZB_15540 [Acidiphilium sp.]
MRPNRTKLLAPAALLLAGGGRAGCAYGPWGMHHGEGPGMHGPGQVNPGPGDNSGNQPGGYRGGAAYHSGPGGNGGAPPGASRSGPGYQSGPGNEGGPMGQGRPVNQGNQPSY